MALIKSVFDYMGSLPSAERHESIYLDFLENRRTRAGKDYVDVVAMEASTWSVTERNICKSLKIPYKFKQQNFFERAKIESMMLAKQKTNPNGVSSLKHRKQDDLSFVSLREKSLLPKLTDITRPARGGLVGDRDLELKKRILMSLPNMSGSDHNDVLRVIVGEKLSEQTDMRHMLLKGYLYLQDYMLAFTSDYDDREVADNHVRIDRNATAQSRVNMIVTRKIVIDLANFTEEERDYLALMGGEYPSVKYCSDNIYNGISMEGDDVVFLSTEGETVRGGTSFGSPERMYMTLLNIACKMGCLEDLREVIKDFRGVPYLLEKLACIQKGDLVMELVYPKSHCLRSSLRERGNWCDMVGRTGNYYAMSKTLVADVLLGQTMMASMYLTAESLGAFGRFGVPSGNHGRDELFQSRCREIGVKHEDIKRNTLLQEWYNVKGGRLPFGVSHVLKDIFVDMSAQIDARSSTEGVFAPSLLYMIPYSDLRSTSWGECRGLMVHYPEAGVPYSIHAQNRMRLFAWLFGVVTELPRIGLNEIGQRGYLARSAAEVQWLACAEGLYGVVKVDYTIHGDIIGMEDEMELTASNMYDSYYRGTVCTVAFDSAGEIVNLIEEGGESDKYNPGHTLEGEREPNPEEEFVIGTEVPKKKTTLSLNRERKVEDRERIEREKKIEKEVRRKPKEVKIKIGKEPGDEIPNFRNRLGLKMQNGVSPPEKVESRQGAHNGEAFKYNIVKSKGDGSCGIHAIVTDMVLRGLVRDSDDLSVSKVLEEAAGRPDWHTPEQLAMAVHKAGMGLEIYRTVPTSGGSNVNRIEAFGTEDAWHVVKLRYTGQEWNDKVGHYDLILPNLKGSNHWPGGVVPTLTKVSDSLEELEKFKVFFNLD